MVLILSRPWYKSARFSQLLRGIGAGVLMAGVAAFSGLSVQRDSGAMHFVFFAGLVLEPFHT